MEQRRTGIEAERGLQDLEERVARLELLVVRAACWLVGALLVVGSVLTYVSPHESDRESPLEDAEDVGELVHGRLATIGFRALAWRDSDGELDALLVAAGIGFLGLLACTVAAVFVLYLVGAGIADERLRVPARALATLLTLGAGGAAVMCWVFASSDDVEAGWGLPVFALGVAGFLLLMPTVTRSWSEATSGPRL